MSKSQCETGGLLERDCEYFAGSLDTPFLELAAELARL